MIKYATYNRFAHLFMQFLKNVASTAGSSVSLTLGYKITARVTFEKIFRPNCVEMAKTPRLLKNEVPPAGLKPSRNFSKCSVLVSLSNKILCFALILYVKCQKQRIQHKPFAHILHTRFTIMCDSNEKFTHKHRKNISLGIHSPLLLWITETT